MSGTVIKVEGLSKKYILRHEQKERYTALRDVITERFKTIGKRFIAKGKDRGRLPVSEEFWALKDVFFEVKQGDRVGIIGRNGAGKSTLLKVLSRITEPTAGRVEITGRVASLLEVGTGFHPELTGRENIFLNGAILGMTRAEIRKKFDEIVDFAEIEKFLDTPVKRYSSGMYVRLAFAVAAHLEPEILIVDEVLAVGDAQFQKKCLGKMEEVGREGRTVLFVSHNMSAVQKLCSRCFVLQAGRLLVDESPQKAVNSYLNDFPTAAVFQKSEKLNGNPSIISVHLEQSEQLPYAEMFVHLEVDSNVEKRVSIDLRLSDGSGRSIGFGSLGTFGDNQLWQLKKGIQKIVFSFPVGQLAVGIYFISIDLTEPDHEYYDRIDNCLSFEVTRPPSVGARRVLLQSWGYGSLELPLRAVHDHTTGEKK